MFDGKYTLWGGGHSLFARKLEATLNYLAPFAVSYREVLPEYGRRPTLGKRYLMRYNGFGRH